MKKAPLLFLLLVAACSQATPAQTAAPLHVQYTPASAPWIEAVYACAGKNACKGQGFVKADSEEACLKMAGGRLTAEAPKK